MFFKNKELTIGLSLRERAIELMKKTVDKVVRLILNDKMSFKNINKVTYKFG